MADYRFSPAADKRQDEIWEYTTEQWGENQAEEIPSGFARSPSKSCRQRNPMATASPTPDRTIDLNLSVFFSRYEKHYIFFRELSGNDIGVISILHGAMQVPVRLNEDLREY